MSLSTRVIWRPVDTGEPEPDMVSFEERREEASLDDEVNNVDVGFLRHNVFDERYRRERGDGQRVLPDCR